ncbi:MAG: helix-turn-helix domain-containing protein [Lachnospiraceae bacterium]|nr:helix-turn-helix domain-containing protein [Lachnospiraceae bacterium]
MNLPERIRASLTELEQQGRIGAEEIRYIMAAVEEDSAEQFFLELLQGDIRFDNAAVAHRAKALGIAADGKWIVYHIETAYPEEARELLGQIYSEPEKAVLADGGKNMLRLLHVPAQKKTAAQAKETAEQIVSMINTELMEKVRVGYSDVANGPEELLRADREAARTLQIMRAFYEERLTAAYSSLGIGRLMYSLGTEDCEAFLEEYFGEKRKLNLSEEEQQTINKFFEKSLNISETARDLFMHRNTLVYHLEKLQKKTGLDIRRFDDAMTLKLALLAERYLETRDKENGE